jgi:hypothetical protein
MAAKKKEKVSQDDDEDDDGDYNPAEVDDDNNNDDDDDDAMQIENAVPTSLSYGKRKAVDESFERLFGYKWGTNFDMDDTNLEKLDGGEQALVEMFGPSKAARILRYVDTEGIKRRRLAAQQQALTNQKGDENNIVINLPKKAQTVTETKVFAGQAVQIQRKNNVADGKATASPKKAPAGSKLDDVLAKISGPGKVSTVQKTSEDWEQFKQTDKQLQEELEKKATSKDAFLVKKDFLNRVDHRTFELERDERDRERAKRGN